MQGHKKFLALSHVVLIIVSVLALLPFWMLITASLSNESYAVKNGYKLWPAEWSLDAYKYLLSRWQLFGRGYLITLVVTVVGVVLCVLITMMLSYMLSRPNLPCERLFMLYIIFPMLFNGGLVATYIMYSQTFHIKNTLFALLIPNLVTNSFYIIMVRNFFKSNIPIELIEAARDRRCNFVTLEVRAGNLPAQKLYEKCGFRQVGMRPDYYTRPTENALIYTLEFPMEEP